MTKTVFIAGSTGSIGAQSIEVLRSCPGELELVGLGARSSVAALAAQARELRPPVVAIAEKSLAAELSALVPRGTEVVAGEQALVDLSASADVVLNAVVGFAGLAVTLATLRAGKRLALANKESLVAGGPVVADALATPGAELVPVDSEHCALHQALRCAGAVPGGGRSLRRLLVTASGGPFRGRSTQELRSVTPTDALAHPTWKMGPKITVDSSTLMNKGLEVIEAHLLFDVGYDQIEVVVHPQSIVHSMAEMTDGATIAQLSVPDMRLPIGYALFYPERMTVPFGVIDWSQLARLDFEVPDHGTFPCLSLAYAAGRLGGTAPACLNGANEVAVAAFLDGQIRWSDIAVVNEWALGRCAVARPRDLADVIAADAEGRALATERVEVCAGLGLGGAAAGTSL